MSVKSNGIYLIAASLILGGAIFSAALVSGGVILQKEQVQPKENIVTTTVGRVNLGKVYSESRGMDITLTSGTDKSHDDIKLTNVDPYNFSKELRNSLADIVKNVNEGKKLTGDKAIKPEDLAGNVPLKLNIKTYMNYRSENMPLYMLMINEENITIDENELIEKKITEEAQRIAKESSQEFSSNSFINAAVQ